MLHFKVDYVKYFKNVLTFVLQVTNNIGENSNPPALSAPVAPTALSTPIFSYMRRGSNPLPGGGRGFRRGDEVFGGEGGKFPA